MTTELFDPAANDIVLQRGYTITPEENVVEDRSELGSVKSVALSNRVRRRLSLPYRIFSFEGREYLEGFHAAMVGSAGRFWFDMPELISSPQFAPAVQSLVGGTRAARTITVRFTWKTDTGETLPSPTATLAVPAGELIQVTIPVFPGTVTEARLYAAEDDPGNEVLQTTLDNERVWTQLDATLPGGGGTPPSSNTALERILAKFANRRFSYERGLGVTYQTRIELEEVDS